MHESPWPNFTIAIAHNPLQSTPPTWVRRGWEQVYSPTERRGEASCVPITVRVLITAFPEWQHSQTCPTQHFLHRSSKTPKWEKSQEPYLSFLLSIAPLEIMKPPSSTPFPKLRIPNQIHQSAASLLFPGPESMAEWIPSGRSLGGKGYVQAPPPPLQASVSLPGLLHPFIQLA